MALQLLRYARVNSRRASPDECISPRKMRTSIALAVGCLFFMFASWAAAGEERPRVVFDAPRTAPAIDLSATSHCVPAAPRGDERLVEIQLDLTTAVLSGRAEEIGEIRFFIEPSWPSATIVDYEPKTELESEAAGNVAVETKLEATDALGLTVSGVFQDLLQAAGNASKGTKRVANETYQQLPNKKTVSASGTLGRQRAAYFRIVATPRTTLEGARPLKLVVAAPKEWRAGLLQVACRATAASRDGKPAAILGANRFLVGVYLAGDREAQALAEEHAAAEGELRALAFAPSKPSRESESKSGRWRLPFLTASTDPAPAQLFSDDWLRRTLFPIDAREVEATNAPMHVRGAIERYGAARSRLLGLRLDANATLPEKNLPAKITCPTCE